MDERQVRCFERLLHLLSRRTCVLLDASYICGVARTY